jgi:acetate kinase
MKVLSCSRKAAEEAKILRYCLQGKPCNYIKHHSAKMLNAEGAALPKMIYYY